MPNTQTISEHFGKPFPSVPLNSFWLWQHGSRETFWFLLPTSLRIFYARSLFFFGWLKLYNFPDVGEALLI